jgi:hypothetical protein
MDHYYHYHYHSYKNCHWWLLLQRSTTTDHRCINVTSSWLGVTKHASITALATKQRSLHCCAACGALASLLPMTFLQWCCAFLYRMLLLLLLLLLDIAHPCVATNMPIAKQLHLVNVEQIHVSRSETATDLHAGTCRNAWSVELGRLSILAILLGCFTADWYASLCQDGWVVARSC